MKRSFMTMCLLVSAASNAWCKAQTCPVVNLMPAFWSVVQQTPGATQVQAFRNAITDKYPQLYSPDVLQVTTPAALDKQIEHASRDASKNRAAIEAIQGYLRSNLSSYIADFQHKFPDFRCDFTIYLMPSLGHFDGMGHVVAGRPALLFGVDMIADLHKPNSLLKIFVDHELFHRYHSQIAGMSDDLSEREVLWRALWAEGLATYVSMGMNPGTSLQDALFVPKDLANRAQPHLRDIIADIRVHLDEVNAGVYSRYFDFGGSSGDLPPRSGYYVGCLVAETLGRKHSLYDLAHMRSSTLRSAIEQALDDVAHR